MPGLGDGRDSSPGAGGEPGLEERRAPAGAHGARIPGTLVLAAVAGVALLAPPSTPVALPATPVPGANPGQAAERAPVETTAYFAFHSHFETNLNDALIAAGTSRRFTRPELFRSGPETACFDGLPAAERDAWDRAVDYYAETVVPGGNFGREQGLLRRELASLDVREPDADGRRFLATTEDLRAGAAPAYETCRWPAQDRENRRWIDAVLPLLAAHEEVVGRRLDELYQSPLHGLPLPVDVVPAALPTGASSIILAPEGGHILVSSLDEGNKGLAALEVVFHEASHTVVAGWRDDPLPRAIRDAAEALGVTPPDDLWHVLLFYTTGETVRGILEEAGQPGYTPYLYRGLFDRAWPEMRAPVESVWPAYLAGERTLLEAVTDVLRALDGEQPG